MEATYFFASKEEYDNYLRLKPLDGTVRENSGSKYVPIESVEAVADLVFFEWYVKDIIPVVVPNLEQLVNAQATVIVTKVVIVYTPSYPDANPITIAGMALKPVSSKSKLAYASAATTLKRDLSATTHDAVRNALKRVGNIFGRNIGRKSDDNYSIQVGEQPATPPAGQPAQV